MRQIGWLFGAALFVAAGAPALAQDQAAQIKQEVADFLAPFAISGAPGEEAGLSHGDVDVAAAGSSYLVTIPELRWQTAATGYFDIGAVTFNLTPDGADLYRIADVKFPATVPHKAPDGAVDGSVSLPTPQLSAVWSRSLADVMQLDAHLRDVRVVSTADNFTLSLGEIGVRVASADQGNGRWDLDYVVHLGGVNLTSSDGLFSFGAADGSFGLRGYNVKGWAAVRDRMQAIAQVAQANPAPPAALPDPQLAEALRRASPLFAGSSVNARISAVSFRDNTGKELFNLPTGMLGVGAEAFDQAIGRVVLSLTHSGLVVNDIAPADQDLLPRDVALNIALENLRVQELWKGAVDTLSSADLSNDEGSGMAMMMFIGLLQQSLVTGKTRVNLSDSHLALALARAQLSGLVEASAESVFGGVGKMVVDITGLDPLIDAVTAHGGPQGAEVGELQIVRGYGNRRTAADGTVTDHYDIDFTPQGQILVNGKEFSFMGPGGGEMPPDSSMAPDTRPVEGTAGDATPADGTVGDSSSSN
jgi:hypothetical protein